MAQNRDKRRENAATDDLDEHVVFVNRCAKTVKGGRRMSFSAVIVVGDREGKVGVGFGKANEAISLDLDSALSSSVRIPVIFSKVLPLKYASVKPPREKTVLRRLFSAALAHLCSSSKVLYILVTS